MPGLGRAAGVWLLAACVGSGCMTIDTRRNVSYEGPRTFSGSRASLGYIGDGFLSLSIPLMLIFMVDLPFSLVADTLLLPLIRCRRASRARRAAGRGCRANRPRP